MKRKPTFKRGDIVKFSLRDINPIEFGIHPKTIKRFDEKTCAIEGVALADNPGDKDYEYYDISFGDITMESVSGYHLTMVHKA